MNQDNERFSSHGVPRGARTRTSTLGALAAAIVLLGACNAITGAGDLRLKDVDEEEDDNSTGGQVLAGGGPISGGATGGTTGNTSSSSTGGAVACTYPEGPYGKDMGTIVSNVHKWQGYAEGTTDAAQTSEISIEDYYDCDGSKKINALMIIESAEWCGNCAMEASQLNSNMAKWQGMGIRVLTLMAQNISSGPATIDTAYKWKSKYSLETSAVGIDPPITFTPSGSSSIGLPLIVVIDPRTMEIVHSQEGYSGSHTELETLAQKNATTP
jgi:thiol-disulfide isomerase/thioredoxin